MGGGEKRESVLNFRRQTVNLMRPKEGSRGKIYGTYWDLVGDFVVGFLGVFQAGRTKEGEGVGCRV